MASVQSQWEPDSSIMIHTDSNGTRQTRKTKTVIPLAKNKIPEIVRTRLQNTLINAIFGPHLRDFKDAFRLPVIPESLSVSESSTVTITDTAGLVDSYAEVHRDDFSLPGIPEPLPFAGSSAVDVDNVADWYTQEVWRLVGWDVLEQMDD